MTTNLLEYFHNSVTRLTNEHGSYYEVAKHNCNCLFCPDCSKARGYELRKRLIPILETFKDMLLVTFTIDPKLFSNPKEAFLYVMDKRCISVTTQDLRRWGYLHSNRYFYVIEWQKDTEQVHFHILFDASYIPWEALLRSWSKHRPKDAGPVIDNRPAFGTAHISKSKFKGGFLHAARYVTKYLTKMPLKNFPQWVMNMGKNRRIRRYSTSKGFWNNPPKPVAKSTGKTREVIKLTYAQRISKCGQSVNLFAIETLLNPDTGELTPKRFWVGQLDIDAKSILDALFDPGDERRQRRSLLANSLPQAIHIINKAVKKEVQWLRMRKTKIAA